MIDIEKLTKQLFEKVEKTENCWLWNGYCVKGYGYFHHNNKSISAHRASWIIHNQQIKDNLLILHKCDIRNCVNPSHLFLGTHKDNFHDMKEKGRSGKGIFGNGFDYSKRQKIPNAKLTINQVIEIKKLIAKGLKNVDIATQFNLHDATISKIKKGQRWQNIKYEEQ